MGTVTVETRSSAPSERLLRLLLLEQDASEAAKILRELKRAGLEIAPCVAGNQLEVTNALSSGNFDAVISAWTYSDVAGKEALEILRESCGESPLVLVTGDSEDKAAEECARCGAIDYVSKDRCLNARDAMPDGGLLKIETEMIVLDDSFCHFYPGGSPGPMPCFRFPIPAWE